MTTLLEARYRTVLRPLPAYYRRARGGAGTRRAHPESYRRVSAVDERRQADGDPNTTDRLGDRSNGRGGDDDDGVARDDQSDEDARLQQDGDTRQNGAQERVHTLHGVEQP